MSSDGEETEGRRRHIRDGSRFETIAAYSRAARHGNVVAVSGTAALDDDGTALFPGDTYAQTKEALRRAVLAVEVAGGTSADVIRTRLYLVNGAEWPEAARAHEEQFRGVNPASTMLFVAGFPPRGVLVEVEIDAVLLADC